MYDNNHSPGNESLLLDTMEQLKFNGDPWELVFDEQVPQSSVSLIFMTLMHLHSVFPYRTG
jgi:hypothetical protein